MWLVAWYVLLLGNTCVAIYAWTRIDDENEADLPLDRKPSWRLFRFQPFPWTVLTEHRRRYPGSRLRSLAVLAMVTELAILVTPVVAGAAGVVVFRR